MWLRSLRLVFVAVLTGMALACLAFLWRSDDQYINQLNYDDNEETSKNDMHKAYSHIKTIVFFIGYARSRHSLLGSFLDAHPHMVVSDETKGFYRWRSNTDQWIQGSIGAYYDTLVRASERDVTKGRRSHVLNGPVVNSSLFSYYVPNQWQGRFDGYIEVIGDKQGAGTAEAMMEDDAIDAVHLLERASGVKVKFVHVVRNPFDNIATMTLRHRNIRARGGQHETKILAPDILDQQTRKYFFRARGSNKAREAFPGQVIDIPSMEIIKHPAHTLRTVCAFLEITCSEDYIQDCAATVDPVPSITRDYVEWSKEQKERVYEQMKEFSFFKGYSYDE